MLNAAVINNSRHTFIYTGLLHLKKMDPQVPPIAICRLFLCGGCVDWELSNEGDPWVWSLNELEIWLELGFHSPANKKRASLKNESFIFYYSLNINEIYVVHKTKSFLWVCRSNSSATDVVSVRLGYSAWLELDKSAWIFSFDKQNS